MKQEQLVKYFSAVSQPQSNYALDNFVDGGQLTPERRLRQAIIETESASKSYEDAEYALAKLSIKYDKAVEKMAHINSSLESNTHKGRLLKLKISKQERDIVGLKRSMKGRKRELDRHIDNLQKYQTALGLTGEESEEDVYSLLQNAEPKHYITKLAVDTAAHMISRNGGPSSGVLLALQQMPKTDISLFKDTLDVIAPNMGQNNYIEALHDNSGIDALIDTATEMLENTQ